MSPATSATREHAPGPSAGPNAYGLVRAPRRGAAAISDRATRGYVPMIGITVVTPNLRVRPPRRCRPPAPSTAGAKWYGPAPWRPARPATRPPRPSTRPALQTRRQRPASVNEANARKGLNDRHPHRRPASRKAAQISLAVLLLVRQHEVRAECPTIRAWIRFFVPPTRATSRSAAGHFTWSRRPVISGR